MLNSGSTALEGRADFGCCVLSLGGDRLSTFPLPRQAHGSVHPSALSPRIEPKVLVRRLSRYMLARRMTSFRLVLLDADRDPEICSYLEHLFAEVARLAEHGLGIDLCLCSMEPRLYDQRILDRIGQLGGTICVELPEKLPGRPGEAQAAHWVEQLHTIAQGSVGTVPLQIHASASPAIAPLSYIRWLEQLPRASLDVLWPRHFSWDFPPWSSRFDLTKAEYQQSPIYGQWFADLFRLWWVLDNPNLRIESFMTYLGTSADKGAAPAGLGRDSFIVARDGEFRLPRRERDWSAVGSYGTGLHMQAIDIATLERLRRDQQRHRPGRDVMLTDWGYFLDQVRRVLASDSYADFYFDEQEASPPALVKPLMSLVRS